MPTPLRVLIVEDEENDAELNLRALRRGGYDVEWRRVDSPDGFAHALETGVWDVILSDHRMPGFTSDDALRLLQACSLDVPFLIVSGTIGEEVAVQAMRLGARDYILKSSLNRLAPAVERELREAEGRRARRTAEAGQREAEERYRALVEQIPAVTYMAVMSAGETHVNFVSPQIEAIADLPAGEWMGRPGGWLGMVHPDDRDRFLEEHRRAQESGRRFVCEYRVLVRGGHVVWVRDEGVWTPDPESGGLRVLGFVVDVTDRREAEETIRHLAYHDPLTGLGNHAWLRQQLETALADDRRSERPLALLRLGLDRLREVNNTLGRETGDALIQAVGQRLSALEPDVLVARIGAGEFAIAAPDCDGEAAERLAHVALHAVQQPIVASGVPLAVEATVGIALFPSHAMDTELLMRRADVALDAARRSIGGAHVYTRERDPYDPRRLMLLAELRGAIDGGQLFLAYQPKIELATRRVVGVEALVRWRHPELGQVSPGEFIPLAEESALIRPLTRWVLNEALRQCRAWREAGKELCVSVNLSARNFQDPTIADQIEALLETWDVQPEWICLEITESAIMEDPDRAYTVLDRLSRQGLGISIDDFGTGYSSLAYLRRLPASEMKVDRSFVIGLSSQEGDLAVVRTVVDLGHHLGLQVAAEGVEDAQTWEILASLGCDLAQGYHMARPMPAEDIEGWLAESDYSLAEPEKVVD